jgi:hypothetical protein
MSTIGLYTATEDEFGAVQRAAGRLGGVDLVVRSESDPADGSDVDAAGDRHLLVLPRPFDGLPGDVAGLLVDSGADPDLSGLVVRAGA